MKKLKKHLDQLKKEGYEIRFPYSSGYKRGGSKKTFLSFGVIAVLMKKNFWNSKFFLVIPYKQEKRENREMIHELEKDVLVQKTQIQTGLSFKEDDVFTVGFKEFEDRRPTYIYNKHVESVYLIKKFKGKLLKKSKKRNLGAPFWIPEKLLGEISNSHKWVVNEIANYPFLD